MSRGVICGMLNMCYICGGVVYTRVSCVGLLYRCVVYVGVLSVGEER